MGVIMDLRGRKSSREDDKSSGSGSGNVEEKKACIDCKTTKTPLWRVGPAGPKSLCNACGIKYRKKRTVVGLEKVSKKKKEKTQITSNTSSDTNSSTSTTAATSNTAKVVSGTGNGLISESLRMSLKVWGDEMMLQTTSIVKKQRCQRKRKLREEEQAAFSLMALSCGSVFA